MTATLAGTGVLVTRPATQAARLCELITERGGRAYRLPSIEIEPVTPELPPDLGDSVDIVIFISRNAVTHGSHVLLRLEGALPEIAAVGPGTATDLATAGIRVTLGPGSTASSEGLLAVAGLTNVAAKKILIIRGVGGRELLADTLRRRGAEVIYAEVYRRLCPDHPRHLIAIVDGALSRGQIRFVIANSILGLKNLVGFFHAPTAGHLLGAELVTGSERVVKEAETLGFELPPVLAAGPSDDDLVASMEARASDIGESSVD